ncbi:MULTISPECIES: pentapeptide repeat-containing protein [Clostridium]|uniref:Pentapeptide repeat-containing protein n=1 Tax=Clostridium cibarium TaxID=2762247 RepID=A0ABR8PVL1_9CLOT|nr:MULTISPECIES: pentapeptide repeat-containing protein [Clostridium]MBD7912221.1 pentapeptide repeat-containing protein [Clostridium cibarium]
MIYEDLKADCKKCFGFCCVALYFSSTEGFPENKDAGYPCTNLEDDFKCSIHKKLTQNGLKGCTAYDCFGAGQKVAQVTYSKKDWRRNSDKSKEMFDVFLIMRQLYEMIWYLTEAFRIQTDSTMKEKINIAIDKTRNLTNLDAESLIKLDLVVYRNNINRLLLETSESIRSKFPKGQKNNLKGRKKIAGRLDLIGVNLRKVKLAGEDLSGALVIAADLRGVDLSGTDLIGADLRDADIRGANLKNSIYITQIQINGARGDSNTKLPISLVYPDHWDK